MDFSSPISLIAIFAVVLFVTIVSLTARYKRCPSDKILVIYGRTGGLLHAVSMEEGLLYGL